MKHNWKEARLGEIAEVVNGRAYRQSELLHSGKYPVLRVGNFFTNQNWYYSDLELPEKNYCDYGDLLYAWSASFGPQIWKGEKAIFHYHIWKLVFDEMQVDRDFLFFYLDWDKVSIKQEKGAGTTMLHVTKESMEARTIHLPPLVEQQHIASVLHEITEGLNYVHTQVERNIQNAQDLYASILQTKMRAEFETWEEKAVSQTFTRLRVPRKVKKTNYLPLGEFPIVSQGSEPISGYWNNPDDVVAIERPVVVFGDHTRCFKFIDFDFVVGADGTQIMVPNAEIDPEFYFYAVQAVPLESKGYARHFAQLKQSKIRYPDCLDEQREIAITMRDFRTSTRALIDGYAEKLRDIDDVRQSILERAFNGELT